MGGLRVNFRRTARAVSWGIAVCALGFVAWVIPIRDRCWDPAAPATTRVSVTRSASGCVLHVGTGDVQVSTSDCARLECEPGLAATLERTRPVVLWALLAIYAVGHFAWAVRWRILLSFAGIDLTLWRVWRISTEAQAGGILLPGGIGGDALRIASILGRPTRPGEPRAPAVIVVASVLLDRALGLSLIAGVAAVAALATRGRGGGPLIVVLAAIPAGFLLSLPILRHPGLRAWLPVGRVDRWVGPVLAYMRDPRAPRAIASAAAVSLVVAAVQFTVIRGLVFALGGAPTAEKWVYVGTAMALIVSAVPALPGGWGTSDAAFVFFFRFAGLKPGLSLAVCLLYRLFWYVSGAVGAILHLARAGGSPGENTPTPTNTT
jgi:uncharacterized membrane protein YbhN (UPF0104 family)